MVRLPLHGPDAALHPHDPLDDFPVLVAVIGKTESVLLVVARRQVEQDRAALEDAFFFAVGFVYYCRDAAVC